MGNVFSRSQEEIYVLLIELYRFQVPLYCQRYKEREIEQSF